MKNLDLQGIKCTYRKSNNNIKPFKKLSVIDKVINKTKINFKFIDLGGGMGISYSKKEKTD